jgi:SAM-dependent methyltransferase
VDWYAGRHRHIRTGELPPLLRQVRAAPGVIADVGCGDGAFLSALRGAGLALDGSYGIDSSKARVERASEIDGVNAMVGDATALPLPDASVDGVVCSQVIEHVRDQQKLVAEVARILRPGGWWYIGSCIRGRPAWWIYRRDGRTWLDPTHVREYSSEPDFRAAIMHPDLAVEALQSEPLRFPIVELGLRAVGKATTDSFERHPWLLGMRRFRVRVPGYRLVEAVGMRPEA